MGWWKKMKAVPAKYHSSALCEQNRYCSKSTTQKHFQITQLIRNKNSTLNCVDKELRDSLYWQQSSNINRAYAPPSNVISAIRIKRVRSVAETRMWVRCHKGMARPQVADEDGPQIWKVAANILNKQSRMNDKGWPSSLGVGRGATNSAS
jgi:hypothetical protein